MRGDNRPVADQLGAIRDEMRALKAREAALREALLKGGAALEGLYYVVEVKRSRRRVFARERLPAEIAEDPRYFEVRETQAVTVRRRRRPAGAVATDDFQVVDLDDMPAPWL